MKPTTETAKRVAAIFGRSPTTSWHFSEVINYRNLLKAGYLSDESELKMIERYYRVERAKGGHGVHRRDLTTFLNNYEAELDRARALDKRFQPIRTFRKPKGNVEKPTGTEERDRITRVVRQEVLKFRNNLRGSGERTTECPVRGRNQ